MNDLLSDMQSKGLASVVKRSGFLELIALLCDGDLRHELKMGKLFPLNVLVTLPETYDIMNLYKTRN